ncbi:hypothetical protein DRB05_17480 [Pseudoalteromonas sp. A757]|nr:hypothetical protein DRB05_17480 [Pseudoalteromonas sp. A757]
MLTKGLNSDPQHLAFWLRSSIAKRYSYLNAALAHRIFMLSSPNTADDQKRLCPTKSLFDRPLFALFGH